MFAVLKNLNKNLRQPILITQHMPATFTAMLAEHVPEGHGLEVR